jgi:peroxiredoxin
MQDYTATLQVGARAPEFNLRAANRQEDFSLSRLLATAPLIVEFLRGTW